MNFTNIFQKEKKKQENDTKIPSVKFCDSKLRELVGKIFQLENIEREFGIILKNVGISEDEICNLKSWHQNPSFSINLSADCYLEKSQEIAKLELEKMGGLDMILNNTITINYKNFEKTYRYYKGEIKQEAEKARNLKTGNEFKFEYIADTSYFYLSNDNNYMEIIFRGPEDISYTAFDMFKLNNDKELTDYLFNLQFSIDFDALCQNLKDFYFKNKCSKLEIKIKKKFETDLEVTDFLKVDDTGITDLMVTKNGQSYVSCNYTTQRYLNLYKIAAERNSKIFETQTEKDIKKILKLIKKK